jgi:hypothetical protein
MLPAFGPCKNGKFAVSTVREILDDWSLDDISMDTSWFCGDVDVADRKTNAMLEFLGDKKIVEGL